jgi:hypothetical protein
MRKRFITEYKHKDGSRWAGPEFKAATQGEAEKLARKYPIRLRVLGELVAVVEHIAPCVAGESVSIH